FKMGSSSKKILMMLNEENNLETKETDTNSKRSFHEGDVGHKSAAIPITNSSMYNKTAIQISGLSKYVTEILPILSSPFWMLQVNLISWVHTGRSIALRLRAAAARSKDAGGVDVPRAIHAHVLERALPTSRDPCAVGFCASQRCLSCVMRAVWTVVLVRAIHLAMDISERRRLISLYKEFKCLWDPKDSNYTNRGVRDDARRQISREMGNKSIENLKKKMRSLAGGYRREKHREKQSRVTGSGAYGLRVPWYAYSVYAYPERLVHTCSYAFTLGVRVPREPTRSASHRQSVFGRASKRTHAAGYAIYVSTYSSSFNNENIIRLIQLYEFHRVLWDSTLTDYRNNDLRQDAWKAISNELSIPIGELKKR
ncbi:hypothetical protein HF086_002896, partial [Spodoptera exigua]